MLSKDLVNASIACALALLAAVLASRVAVCCSRRADVAVAPDRSKLFVVLDHETPEGDARLREFKVVHIDALLQRGECEPTPL